MGASALSWARGRLAPRRSSWNASNFRRAPASAGGRVLLELELQRAPRDAEASRGFRDVAAAVREDAAEVLPLGARQRRRGRRRRRLPDRSRGRRVVVLEG